MKHFDILGRLEQVIEDAKPRCGQSFLIVQDTAEARRIAVLDRMQATILPRIVQITNEQEDAVTLAIANGRVADIRDTVMDGVHAIPPDTTPDHVARILSMVCSGTGVRVDSTPPDEQDDIAATGLQISAIASALNALQPVPSAPESAEPDFPDETELDAKPPSSDAATEVTTPASSAADAAILGMATSFFDRGDQISDQRILVGHESSTVIGPDSVLTQNIDAVQQMLDDLAAWEADSNIHETGPQLVILRAQSQDMPSLTICRDAESTSMTAHHTRKLGSVVQLWKSLTAQENFS